MNHLSLEGAVEGGDDDRLPSVGHRLAELNDVRELKQQNINHKTITDDSPLVTTTHM